MAKAKGRGVLLSLIAIPALMMFYGAAWAGAPVSPWDDSGGGDKAAGNPLESIAVLSDPLDWAAALAAGADYLRHAQADVTEDNAGNGTDGVDETPNDPQDGGWDWVSTIFTHSTSASPKNIYGATGQGVYYAYLESGDSALLTTLTDAADVMKGDSGIRSAADLIFLMNYNDLAAVSGTAYQDSARAKFDGRVANYGSAKALAEYIRDARGVSQPYPNGIIAWDIGAWAVAAAMLGDLYSGGYDYSAAADTIAEVIYQDSFMDNPGLFDIIDDQGFDPTYTDKNFWWYTLGISGLIDAFEASGTHTAEIPGLITILLDSQYLEGGISGSYGANPDDEDWQSTAYTVLSLARVDQATYQTEINYAAYWTGATQDDASGGWVYSSGNHYPEIGGENTAALYFASGSIDDVSAEDPTTCITPTNLCATVPVIFNRVDTTPMRGISVTFELSAELALCTGTPASDITQATGVTSWWDDGTHGTPHFEIVDNLDGTYTVDQAILGVPCGPTTGGYLFDIEVAKAAGVTTDAIGTVTITEVTVRDCMNAGLPGFPGSPATVTIDLTDPPALTTLTATQKKTGNDSNGTTIIDLAWTDPGGDEVTLDIWRKGYGFYPEYDDNGGAVPTAPVTVGNGWTHVATVAIASAAYVDEPATRDFYYYATFVTDACDNVSDASAITDGTLNYHLGDISDGITLGQGDNLVFVEDMSHLSNNYGIPVPLGDPLNYLDVGPTTDYYVDALPTTDDRVQFEDLMMFAINHNQVSKSLSPPAPAARNEIVVRVGAMGDVGSIMEVELVMAGDGLIQGLSVPLTWNGAVVKPAGMQPGDLLAQQGGKHLVLSPQPGTVDAALFGVRATGISGEDVLATLSFHIKADGNPGIELGEITARDAENQFVSINGSVGSDIPESTLPRFSLIRSCVPNPFNPSTEIQFSLARKGLVNLSVYALNGRLVSTLRHEEMDAGPHSLMWYGTDASGKAVSSGTYIVRMEAPDKVQSRQITLLK